MFFGSMLPFAVLAAAAACRGDRWAECDFEVLLAEADMAWSAVHAQPTLPANCDRTYTVVAGDTCDGICGKEHVSLSVPRARAANRPAD